MIWKLNIIYLPTSLLQIADTVIMKIPCGKEVMRSKPFVSVVNTSVVNSICDFCFQTSNSSTDNNAFKKCSGCKCVYYCSVHCQRQSWNSGHREECQYLRKVKKFPTDTVRLLARIILKLKQGGMREFASLPNGQQRYFDDLMSHQKKIVRDTTRIEAFQCFFQVLKDCFGGENNSLPPKTEILEIYGRVLVNSFNIMNDEYQSIGIGLYLAPSVLDHSCDPNCTVIFEGKSLVLRTIKDVDSFDDLRISYTNLLDTKETRREKLAQQYYFSCQCCKCEQEKDGEKSVLECPKCQGNVPLTNSEYKCQHCQRKATAGELENYESLKEDYRRKVLLNVGGHPEPEEQCDSFFKKFKGVFHPFDKTFLDLLELLYEQKIAEQDFQEGLELAILICKHYQQHYPKYDVNLGLMAMKVAKLCTYLNRMNEADEYLDLAKDTLTVTHGASHRLLSHTLRQIKVEVDMGRREMKDCDTLTKSNNVRSG